MFDFLLWKSDHAIKIQLNVDVHKYYYYLSEDGNRSPLLVRCVCCLLVRCVCCLLVRCVCFCVFLLVRCVCVCVFVSPLCACFC